MVREKANIIHSGIVLLEESGLVNYDKRLGKISSTELGRVSSHYYILHESISIFKKNLKPNINLI